MNYLILLALALAPGVAVGLYIYLKDHHEPEPIGMLMRAFFFGVLSTFITMAIRYLIDEYFSINEEDLSQQAIHAFLIVALVEEFSKFIFVRWVFYRNENFNEPFDGIVYSVMVGMGFATFENIQYALNGDIGTAFLRIFTAVPAHASFAVLMGYFLGKAKFEHRKGHYTWYALGVATLFHGAYDYFCFISYVPGIWLGAIASLAVAILFSRQAIRIHQGASPFRQRNEPPVESVKNNNPNL